MMRRTDRGVFFFFAKKKKIISWVATTVMHIYFLIWH